MSDGQATPRITRRRFLASSAAFAAASSLPVRFAAGQTSTAAKYRRMNLSDPSCPPKVLDSYRKAVAAMLALPPAHRNNWYRNAFVHLLDCPHKNWWFFPWHRGYLHWFEEACRHYSGDSTFALPYWDWTTEPRIPAAFYEGALNPANVPFIPTLAEFVSTFTNPLGEFWKNLTPAQQSQVESRHYPTLDALWESARWSFPRPPRSRPASQPDFDPWARKAVAIETLRAALAPRTFTDFGGSQVKRHDDAGHERSLESQPHDAVHGMVGGLMYLLLSPLDPLFFVHHANLDRLWDIWTRKQLLQQGPTQPTTDLGLWMKEPFLFFVDAAGQPAANQTAGDCLSMSAFGYDYQPGPAEDVAHQALAPTIATFGGRSFPATLKSSALTLAQPTTSTVTLPATLFEAASADQGPTLFARITLQPPADPRNLTLRILVNPVAGATALDAASPHYAGQHVFFATHPHMAEAVTFDVPLSPALRALRGAKLLKTSEPLEVQVVAENRGDAPQDFTASIQEVLVGTY